MSGWLGGGGPHLSCSGPHSAGHSSNSSQGTMLGQWWVIKPHKVPHLVCLGGGVWGRSVERGLLALLLLQGGGAREGRDGGRRREGEGREEGREREVMAGERQGKGNKSGCDPMYTTARCMHWKWD